MESTAKKEFNFPYQTSILEQVLASRNDLRSLVETMRADYYDNKRSSCSIWLAGNAWSKDPVLKIDHKFYLESDAIGIGISIHPEDSVHAAIPAYHSHQTEVIVVFEGEARVEYLNAEGEVIINYLPKGSAFILNPNECHRVTGSSDEQMAFLFVKANLSMEPDKVTCDSCRIIDAKVCPLRRRWLGEAEESLSSR